MVQMFDHRAATIEIHPENVHRPAQEIAVEEGDHERPDFSSLPQFWVARGEVEPRSPASADRNWLLGYKDVTAPTNMRTVIVSAIPYSGVGNTLCQVRVRRDRPASCLLSNLASFPLDFVARQKVGGQHLNFFIVEQFPVLPPKRFSGRFNRASVEDFIRTRILELVYTANDIRGFAEDLGFDGPPFRWDEERRLHLRCQLDALFFHLYGLCLDEAGYILDTFPIVREKNEARFGRFRTKDLIIAYHRAYAAGNMEAWVKG